MRHLYKILLFLYVLIIGCMTNILNAQNLGELVDLVDEKDKKVVEKALGSIDEAGKLTQESNDYYNEAIALQSNYELDEKTLQSKLSKAEGKAVSLQIKADKLYAAAYKSLHEICKRNLSTASVTYGETVSFESSSDEMMTQAEAKRKEAGNNKNAYNKAALLNQAAALEGAAIDNLLVALKVQRGDSPVRPATETTTYTPPIAAEETYTPPPPPVVVEETYTSSSVVPDNQEIQYEYTPPVNQKSENLGIDQKEIDKYKAYVNDPSIPDPIMVNRSGVSGLDDVSLADAKEVFQQAHSPETKTYEAPVDYQTPDMQLAIQDTMNTLVDIDMPLSYAEDTYTENTSQYTIEDSGEVTENSSFTSNLSNQEEYTHTDNSRFALDISSSEQVDGVRFMVQIAASKIPLTRSQLWAIYPGKMTLQVYEEEGWYKYRISGFRLFTEANKTAIESGVKEAWVLSQVDNRMIDLPEAREMTRVLEKDVNTYGRKALKNRTDFYVQVAASRIRFTDDKLRQYCGGSGICREVIEEGWFKYQIYAGTDYNAALSLKGQAAGDAFIVAYEQGMKIELYNAINESK